MADFLTHTQEYLDYVLSSARLGEGEATRTMRLIQILDKLAAETEFTDDGPSDSEAEPCDFQALYKKIGVNFPDLGYYSTVLDIDPLKTEHNLAIGDAIDDLADIARELLAVIRTAELLGVDAARREFNFLFCIHWGFHLRELQLYLYCRLTGF